MLLEQRVDLNGIDFTLPLQRDVLIMKGSAGQDSEEGQWDKHDCYLLTLVSPLKQANSSHVVSGETHETLAWACNLSSPTRISQRSRRTLQLSVKVGIPV